VLRDGWRIFLRGDVFWRMDPKKGWTRSITASQPGRAAAESSLGAQPD
jgi:hypothetical protein